MRSVFITRAGPSDLAACVALLPPITASDSAYVVARDGTNQLLGAAGIDWRSVGDPPGFPAWIAVMPDRRCAGIGRRLAAALLDLARGEAPALWAATPLKLSGPEAEFAQSLGFECHRRQLYFRAGAKKFLVAMDEIMSRLLQRGRVPETAITETLSEANAADVVALVDLELQNAPLDMRSLISRSLEGISDRSAPIDISRSSVLTLHGEVVGALLSRRDIDGINSRIILNAVAPSLRRGWANAMLLEATTRLGVNDGCEWFDFDCDEKAKDTIGLARRGEAELVRTEGLYFQAVTREAD